jgi:hypothetical protein
MISKPLVYYPGGGGGNWLNYVIWCGQNKSFLPGSPLEFGNLSTKIYRYFDFIPHADFTKSCNIRFGSEQAYINCYINVLIKNPSWTQAEPGGYIKMKNHDWDWNLDYTKIFSDPKEFLQQLNRLTGLELKLNRFTERAFEQYYQSCPWYGMSESQLLETTWIKDSWQYCFDFRTASDNSVETRTQQAWDEVKSCLFTI